MKRQHLKTTYCSNVLLVARSKLFATRKLQTRSFGHQPPSILPSPAQGQLAVNNVKVVQVPGWLQVVLPEDLGFFF